MRNIEENIDKLNKYFEYRDSITVDIVDLVKSLAIANGVNIKKTRGVEIAEKLIPKKKHTIFIILDGFGFYKLSRLDKDSILKQNAKMRIKTVNPTSTAAVLTSIVSASYPNEHGIYGWWDYNKDYKLNYYPLLLEERKTGEKLSDKNISTQDIFKFVSIFDKFKTNVNVYEKIEIINSEYTKMFSSNAQRHGFYSVKECFEKIYKNLQDSKEPTFNYVYIDGIDEASHQNGVDSIEVSKIIDTVENGIKYIKENLDDVGFVLTADHGQIDMANMLYLNKDKDFSKYFYALPSIDTRMISFFVKDEYKKEFETEFMKSFSEDVILLTKEEAKKCKLFGTDTYTKHADKSLGEYIAVVVNNKFMVCDKIMVDDYIHTKGNHSGLTKEEVTVPFVVIE